MLFKKGTIHFCRKCWNYVFVKFKTILCFWNAFWPHLNFPREKVQENVDLNFKLYKRKKQTNNQKERKKERKKVRKKKKKEEKRKKKKTEHYFEQLKTFIFFIESKTWAIVSHAFRFSKTKLAKKLRTVLQDKTWTKNWRFQLSICRNCQNFRFKNNFFIYGKY